MDYKKALIKAMNLCSVKEYCVYDINEKLQKWEVQPDDAEKIISRLLQEHFIDEDRYLTHFINDKLFMNKWGKRKVAYALKMKHFSEATLNEALDKVDEAKYSEMIFGEMEKKKKKIKGEQYIKQKAKLFNFGSSRGYETDKIYAVLEKLFNN